MHHVLVETTWLVEYARPDVHNRNQAALNLLAEAKSGKIRLYLPHICLIQARSTIPKKFSPKNLADDLRSFLSWLQSRCPDKMTAEEAQAAKVFIDRYQSYINNEFNNLRLHLEGLRHRSGVEVFSLTEPMREKAIELAASDLKISLSKSSYDNDILAAILVKGKELSATTSKGVFGLDADMQPWFTNKNSGLPEKRQPLASHFDDAGIWVYGDFTRSQPPCPAAWPPTSP